MASYCKTSESQTFDFVRDSAVESRAGRLRLVHSLTSSAICHQLLRVEIEDRGSSTLTLSTAICHQLLRVGIED